MYFLLVILLVVVAIGLLPTWPHAAGYQYGYFPSGFALVLIIGLIVLLASGRIG